MQIFINSDLKKFMIINKLFCFYRTPFMVSFTKCHSFNCWLFVCCWPVVAVLYKQYMCLDDKVFFLSDNSTKIQTATANNTYLHLQMKTKAFKDTRTWTEIQLQTNIYFFAHDYIYEISCNFCCCHCPEIESHNLT